MTIHVQPLTTGHIAGYRECLDEVARERRYLAQVEALPEQAVTDFLQKHLAGNAAIFVAIDGNRVVGWADILPDWPDAKSHCGTLGMGLLPDYRGRGLGRRLLRACLDKAWANGLVRIELEVRADNEPAIRLYEGAGFLRECVKKQALRFDGAFHDALQMSLVRDGA